MEKLPKSGVRRGGLGVEWGGGCGPQEAWLPSPHQAAARAPAQPRGIKTDTHVLFCAWQPHMHSAFAHSLAIQEALQAERVLPRLRHLLSQPSLPGLSGRRDSVESGVGDKCQAGLVYAG